MTLIHLLVFLSLATFSVTDVPSRLFAISHLKSLIKELQENLVKFKKSLTLELDRLENFDKSTEKRKTNETACLEAKISQAHKETRKMLNMLIEGETNQLQVSDTTLDHMTLSELSRLWGTLAVGGDSWKKMEAEMENFRKAAKARILEARKPCKN